jgi:hypothetical protein
MRAPPLPLRRTLRFNWRYPWWHSVCVRQGSGRGSGHQRVRLMELRRVRLLWVAVLPLGMLVRWLAVPALSLRQRVTLMGVTHLQRGRGRVMRCIAHLLLMRMGL